jgi:hypothetical protein
MKIQFKYKIKYIIKNKELLKEKKMINTLKREYKDIKKDKNIGKRN